MYRRILVPLENSQYDELVLSHVRMLAQTFDSTVVLIHVADGFAARNLRALTLRESQEMQEDRSYLELQAASLRGEGIDAEPLLAGGDPASEIAAAADREKCDLIAMAVHGHKGLQDLIYGQTANGVRHKTTVPVLMVRAAIGGAKH
jgi:nucleotide-binding universal stress UspA family protein